MHVLYVIQHTETFTVYVGITDNLKQRLSQHNRNVNHSTRRKNGKWVLVYAEVYRSKEDLVEREKKFKQRGSAKQRLLKRIEKSLIRIKS